MCKIPYDMIDTELASDLTSMLMRSHLLSLSVVTGLAACAAPSAPIDETARMLDSKLAASAQKIDSMLVDIARAGALTSPAKKPSKVEINGDLVTVIWHGDAPDVIKKMAEAKGLTFDIKGRRVPSPVAIEAVNTPFVAVLENIGVQLGGRGDVILRQQSLEVHYRAN
ncbi:TraH conjugal transfer protein (modular protein) [Cupriavidus taiwanensis]|nr:TraH conjugal transfer protein (modular protein) [Cupriavidus taiwanensis]